MKILFYKNQTFFFYKQLIYKSLKHGGAMQADTNYINPTQNVDYSSNIDATTAGTTEELDSADKVKDSISSFKKGARTSQKFFRSLQTVLTAVGVGAIAAGAILASGLFPPIGIGIIASTIALGSMALLGSAGAAFNAAIGSDDLHKDVLMPQFHGISAGLFASVAAASAVFIAVGGAAAALAGGVFLTISSILSSVVAAPSFISDETFSYTNEVREIEIDDPLLSTLRENIDESRPSSGNYFTSNQIDSTNVNESLSSEMNDEDLVSQQRVQSHTLTVKQETQEAFDFDSSFEKLNEHIKNGNFTKANKEVDNIFENITEDQASQPLLKIAIDVKKNAYEFSGPKMNELKGLLCKVQLDEGKVSPQTVYFMSAQGLINEEQKSQLLENTK